MSTGSFYHGVKTRQISTSIVPPRKSESAMPIVFGCAPIHRLSEEMQARVMPGTVQMIYSLAEAGQFFGIDVNRDDFIHWTLSEFTYSEFQLFNVAPVVYANLFDPAKHKKTVASESVSFIGGTGQLEHPDIIGGVTLTPTSSGEPYVYGTDYALNNITGEITVLEDGALATVTRVTASYAYAAPELVTADECIGGYDVVTGKSTGLSLVDDVFPRYRNVPALLLAPKFGEDPTVAAIMSTKAGSINGVFRAVALCDVPSDGDKAVKIYSDLPEYKQNNNLVSEDLYLTWPKVKFGDKVIRMSTQVAGIIAQVDADYNGIPYASPSNKNLQMTACVIGEEELYLDVERANYLNANGIATALNHQDGWKLWGNRTACYPDVTDTKDNFLTARRMMAWYGNHLIQTWWQKVDWPLNRRLVLTIVNSEQIYLNSLVAAEALHGGRISFLEEENSILDLMDGQVTFHVYLGLVPPAERLDFELELDPDYLSVIYEAINASAA